MLVIVHKLLETSSLLSQLVMETAGRVVCEQHGLPCCRADKAPGDRLGVHACGWTSRLYFWHLGLVVLFVGLS